MKKTIALMTLTYLFIPAMAQAFNINIGNIDLPPSCNYDANRYANYSTPPSSCSDFSNRAAELRDLDGLRNLMKSEFTNTVIDKVANLRAAIIEDLKNDPEFRKALIKELKAELNK